MNASGKRSDLLRYRSIYGRKQFYSVIGPDSINILQT